MESDELYRRYGELQQYVGWTEDDARRVQSVAAALDPVLTGLIDDFYAEIDRHPDAHKVITGGAAQVSRLKGTLLRWLRDLLAGPYDAAYVARRWQVGWRHVEIGLDQVFTNVALSRLRRGLLSALDEVPPGSVPAMLAVRRSLNTLLDLDLAIVEDAYQAEYRRGCSAASGWRPSARSLAVSPMSCATRSTWSKRRSISCSMPATRRRPRPRSICTASSGT